MSSTIEFWSHPDGISQLENSNCRLISKQYNFHLFDYSGNEIISKTEFSLAKKMIPLEYIEALALYADINLIYRTNSKVEFVLTNLHRRSWGYDYDQSIADAIINQHQVRLYHRQYRNGYLDSVPPVQTEIERRFLK